MSVNQAFVNHLRSCITEAEAAFALRIVNDLGSSDRFTIPGQNDPWEWSTLPRGSKSILALMWALHNSGWRVDLTNTTSSHTYMSPERYKKYRKEMDASRAKMPRSYEIQLPYVYPNGKTLYLRQGTKPPKLRFTPGSYLRYDGSLYVVVGAFRTVTENSEWQYVLDERTNMEGSLSELMREQGELAPVIYNFFAHSGDASTYFEQVNPRWQCRRFVGNQKLMQSAELLSSGDIINLSLQQEARVTPSRVIDVTAESFDLPSGLMELPQST